MLDRNRRFFEGARDLGGTRYPISAVRFDKHDWIRHYGPKWRALASRKRRFDPDNILAPGAGIFRG
jgi:cytokinin dehydrogenase